MSKLIFEGPDLIAIGNYLKSTDKFGISLAKDSGIYLVAFLPKVEGQTEHKNLVCYAAGFNPAKDDDWYDKAVAAVGGDDFGEDLTIDRRTVDAFTKPGTKFIVTVTATKIKMVVETRADPLTPEQLEAKVREMMQQHGHQVIGYEPGKVVIITRGIVAIGINVEKARWRFKALSEMVPQPIELTQVRPGDQVHWTFAGTSYSGHVKAVEEKTYLIYSVAHRKDFRVGKQFIQNALRY